MAADSYERSRENEVRQLREKAHYDCETVHGILDAGLVAHVAFVQDAMPVVVPMIYGRDNRTLYLHGARKARVIRLLAETPRACVNVTLLDGIVYARSAFNSSMNYRSVTVFGKPVLIDGDEAKLAAMRVVSEHTMPGRWDELRAPLEREVKMTGVIALEMDAASAKVSAKMPEDDEADYAIPIWAGVLPLEATLTRLVTDPRVPDGIGPSAVVTARQNRKL